MLDKWIKSKLHLVKWNVDLFIRWIHLTQVHVTYLLFSRIEKGVVGILVEIEQLNILCSIVHGKASVLGSPERVGPVIHSDCSGQ
jgi:hypothetical protein